ncbi:hypothetical protein [Mucilaginibacter sp.]|uniref:hypothetical protein n=1 Tax=Mucilaginibacter sp. TaxID=1882438 RepID=UPI0025E999E2|nr:hypothetical protein [Mucilaginibacter sp.]
MQNEPVQIKIYDKREKSTSTIYVEQLAENQFKCIDNDIFNCRLTLGTEFKTRTNEEGCHEIIKITKESGFITRRFFLTSQFRSSDYRLLGDEIVKNGGFWQVDFGGIATINLPKDGDFDIDKIFNIFDFAVNEIKD